MITILMSITDTAEWFDTTHGTIRDLIKAYGRVPKPMRGSPRGKGLDLSDLGVIAKALNRTAPTREDLERRLAVA